MIVDLEGHKVSHRALANDLPRFMGHDGQFANVNLLHSNITIGKVISEFVTLEGNTFKTKVDDIGLFAVVEIRTDKHAPDIIKDVLEILMTVNCVAFLSAGMPIIQCLRVMKIAVFTIYLR